MGFVPRELTKGGLVLFSQGGGDFEVNGPKEKKRWVQGMAQFEMGESSRDPLCMGIHYSEEVIDQV